MEGVGRMDSQEKNVMFRLLDSYNYLMVDLRDPRYFVISWNMYLFL